MDEHHFSQGQGFLTRLYFPAPNTEQNPIHKLTQQIKMPDGGLWFGGKEEYGWNMANCNIIGSWKLQDFTITTPAGVTKNWGTNVHGLLIYTVLTMSVSINKDIERDPDDPQQILNSILFYSGTYEMKNGVIIHHVANASDPNRIGKTMIREAVFKDNFLTLSGKGDFGVAKLVWQRIE